MRNIYIIFGLLIAGVILFVSVARGNLETVLNEEKADKIRVMPVEIITEKENGEKIKSNYYLPKIKILPTNIMYPVKLWRDKLWLKLTNEPCEKSRLLMLIADKQMAENDAISSVEAAEKLIEAWEICPNDRVDIEFSAKAYRQITSKMRKYDTANEKIEKFIKEKEIVLD